MEKPKEILELEQQLRVELKETKNKETILHCKGSNTFLLNEQKQIIGLNLRDNKIRNINFLEQLNFIKFLNLSGNKISNYDILSKKKTLHSLDLSSNRIINHNFLGVLTNLQYLNLEANQYVSPSNLLVLEKLVQIKTLSINSNYISKIDFIKNLTKLRSLDLSLNRISNLKPLEKLTNIRSLDLRNNLISDITPIRYLTKLKSLRLDNHPVFQNANKIKIVTLDFLRYFKQLENLTLYGNPIENIPKEIFHKVADSKVFGKNVLIPVRNYLEGLEKGKSKNKSLKIIFIGNGNIGKTQIAKRLAEQEKFVFNSQHDSTHAIIRMKRKLGDVELQLWDFAGQELYHTTHRLFMQTRALFVLIWDFENEQNPFHTWEGKQYKNEKLLYWLEYARCFGKDSPILVLQNKVDTSNDAQKVLLQQVQNYYQKHYPILDFVQVSAKTGRGFAAFEYLLQNKLEENPTLKTFLNQELPSSWITIRSAIEELQEQGRKTMEKAELQALCQAEKVEKSTETILEYFHDTGVFYYHSRYFGGKIILNQSWAIEAIYQILDRKTDTADILRHQKGKLDYKQLCRVWAKNTDKERELFMNFMLSTELCFETTNNKDQWYKQPLEERNFVVPAFLPENKPLEVDFLKKEYIGEFIPIAQEEKYKRVKRYRFLPSVFMQRFIIAANRLSNLDLIWQRGIVLEISEGMAIVEADYERREVEIQATTPQLLQRIERELDNISREGTVKAQIRLDDSKDPVEMNERYMQGLKGLQPKFTNQTTSSDSRRVSTDLQNKQKKSTFIEDLHLPSTQSKAPSTKQKILFLAANPNNASHLRLDVEFRTIRQELERGTSRDSFDLLLPRLGLTIRELIRGMSVQPEIVHFAGHGTTQGIVMVKDNNESQTMPTAALQRLFRRLEGKTKVVLLNACHSSAQAKVISQYGMYVIGNNVPVEDKAAIQFAKGFYLGLSDGKTIEEAFDDAMIFLLMENPKYVEVVEIWKGGVRLEL